MFDLSHLAVSPSLLLSEAAALISLIVMEVVLGIDNLIFVSLLTGRLPKAHQGTARSIGLGGALLMRIALLFTFTQLVGLTKPVITVIGHGFSWRDLILMAGGTFLIYKAVHEINETLEKVGLEGSDSEATDSSGLPKRVPGLWAAILQILILDLVFSVDSILTAVGMTDHLPIMVIAVVVAVAIMFVAAGPIAAFINRHVSIVLLALGFLLMIGTVLVMEGFGVHVEKGYIYAAMVFAAFIEGLQMMRRGKRHR